MRESKEFSRRWLRRLAIPALALALATGVAACGGDDDGDGGDSGSSGGKKIALLLPESKTARYESQDRPLFEQRIKDQCPDCQVLYSNADQDTSKQQQQVEAAGARWRVLPEPADVVALLRDR